MGLGYFINRTIRGIKQKGEIISPDENGIVTISADASVVCDISDGVIGFRAKLFSVLDSAKSLQIAPIYFRQETNDHQELLLPMVKFSYADDDNFSASFEITGTKTNIRLDVVVDGGDWLPLLSETVDEVVLFTEEERVKLLGISDNANDNVIEEIQVNGTALVPDANKSVNIVMSGGGGGESNVIEIVKVNGTALVPDANKAVDVITVNYITPDMTAAEILAVAARCADENGALKEPIYFNDPILGLVPCNGFSYDSATISVGMFFYYAADYWTIEVQAGDGEVTIEKWQNPITPQNIGAADVFHTHPQGDITGLINALGDKAPLNHDHAGVYQPVESGKGLSTNDLTDTLKTNYDAAYTHSQAAHAPSGAQANVIETVKVNGNALTVTNKAVDIVEPQWRTLNNFTVTTAATLFTFTADSNGIPYNLQAVRVKVMVASGAPADGNIGIKPSFDTSATDIMATYMGLGVKTENPMYAEFEAVRKNGTFDANWIEPAEYVEGVQFNVKSNFSLRGRVAASGTNTLKRVNITCSATTSIPANSTILIEGIDA